MTKRSTVLSTSLLMLAACSGVSFRIDNPTDEPLTVGIDDKQHTVAPHADAAITLEPGKHTFDSPATGKLDIIVYANAKGGLINPTLADYVVVNEIYSTNTQTAKGFMKLESKVVIGDELFKGPFRIHRTLFIDPDWTYGVHEEFADSINVGSGSNGNIVGKIFTASEFVAFYRRRFGVPDKVEAPPPRARTVVASMQPLPHFLNPEMEKAAEPLREHYAKYLVATDPAEQKSLQQGTSKALTELVTVVAPLLGKSTSEENQKYNDLVGAYGQIFGVSARVMP